MGSSLKIVCVIFAFIVAVNSSLPSFITACSRNQPTETLSKCIEEQAKHAQPFFARGLPEFGMEPLDPLTLTDLSAKAGTFSIKNTNVMVKGLRKIEIKGMSWDLQKLAASIRIFGNLTFTSDYETDGRVLLIPINGKGKLTVKMYNTDLTLKWKLRTFTDANGVEHLDTYDYKSSQTYGNVKIHLTNILGGNTLGDTINQVLNENWRELVTELGPPFIKGVADKVRMLYNKFYSQIPFDELITP